MTHLWLLHLRSSADVDGTLYKINLFIIHDQCSTILKQITLNNFVLFGKLNTYSLQLTALCCEWVGDRFQGQNVLM